MSHLNLETLARLIDESPDPTEAGHLDICAVCREELEALRADAAALHALPDPEPPIAAWIALDERLKREGLMRRSTWVATTLRMAAVLAIFVLGSVVGALLMRQQGGPVATTAGTSGTATQVFQRPVHVDTQPASVAMTSQPLNAPVAPAVRPAVNADEAAVLLRDAERSYLAALTRYSEFTNRTDSGDPVARLAALESIVATTRAALGQAPADPVINGYHLTAVAQRDATLRQMAASGQTWY